MIPEEAAKERCTVTLLIVRNRILASPRVERNLFLSERSCGGQMRVVAFIEDPKAIDKIIRHLKLRFQAERPPPSQVIQQELLVAAEQWSEYL